MDLSGKLRFLKWCNQNGHLDGLEYRHRGHGKGKLKYTRKIPRDDTIIFHPYTGPELTLTIESIAERWKDGISEENLTKLIEKYKSQRDRKSNAEINSLNPGERPPPIPSDLYRRIERLIPIFLESGKEYLPHFLKEMRIDFLDLDWANGLLDQIRRHHPKGITTRPAKRSHFFSELEKLIEHEIAEWWVKIDSRPAVTILAHINEIPECCIGVAIQKMVLLPFSCHENFSDQLWGFYDKNIERLIEYVDESPNQSVGPSVIAYVGKLACNPKTKKNCQRLLDIFEKKNSHEFIPLIDFFRFLISDPPQLSGVYNFDKLAETDLFLGACYYKNDGQAANGLRKISVWSLGTIRKQLDDHAYNHFLVSGLQPRIAELAFAGITGKIYGEAGLAMLDLNLQALDSIAAFRLPVNNLPKADWEDASGSLFDVKSNVYYRSKSTHEGLRGFAIKIPERENVTYSGIVFFDTSVEHCEWAYIGDLSKQCYQKLSRSATKEDERVMPFVFQMPEHCRFQVDVTPEEARRYSLLLPDKQLARAWQIASHRPCAGQQSYASSHPQAKDWFWEHFSSLSLEYPVEFRLWHALTEATLDGCSSGSIDEVEAMLKDMASMLTAGILPVRLANVAGKTLLERWIHSVLQPIAAHFDKITCPDCKRGDISLKLNRITAGGSIFGAIECGSCCPNNSREITILTHCHKCNEYPLHIGKNKICEKCYGLVCEAEQNGRICNACKTSCRNNP